MRATRSLPAHFQPAGTFDLRNNLRAMLQLNVFGLVLFFTSAWLFGALAFALRPAEAAIGLAVGFSDLGGFLQALIAVILVTAAMIVLHEAVHGVFFWWYTRAMPLFAFKGLYAYAAAPDWYLPKRQYLVVALAPLVLLSLAGVGLMAVIPSGGMLLLLLFLISNASGAVGDVWVAGWLLRQPAACYANDRGDAVTLYREEKSRP